MLSPSDEMLRHYHPAITLPQDTPNNPIAMDAHTPRHLSSIMDETWFNIFAQILSNLLLFLLVFGMSATVELQHLREQVHNKFAILTGLLTQFIVMPLLGYLSVLLLMDNGLTEPMALSLLIVTSSPGGSYSNWWCSMFNADLALSVTMTAIGTLVSTIMLPANLILYVNAAFGFGHNGQSDGDNGSIISNIDWPSLFISLTIVIFAIGLGLCASFKVSSHQFNKFANKVGSLSGVFLVAFSVLLSSLSNDKNAQIYGQPWSFYVGVSLPCICGLFIATTFSILARLKRPEVVSVGVECTYQNTGIATSAVVSMFSDPVKRGQALCVPIFYGVMEAVVLGIYCIVAWKCGWTKAPRDDKFCAMIMTSYEVEEDEIDSQLDPEAQRSISHRDGEYSESEESGARPAHQSKMISQKKDTEPKHHWWSIFTRPRKRTRSQETATETDHGSVSLPPMESSISLPPMNSPISPVKRISALAADLLDGLESITEKEFGSPGLLVPFDGKDNVEYSRCRLNSDDSALLTIDELARASDENIATNNKSPLKQRSVQSMS